MEFQVDPTTRVPIYRQLMDQIRLAVARGRLKPGSRLPSVRVLSRELVVNPNTIARVYTELERDGVLNTRPGMGVFVAEPQADLSAAADRCRTDDPIPSTPRRSCGPGSGGWRRDERDGARVC